MPENSERKEPDAFEKEMQRRIVNISDIMNNQPTDHSYYVGKVRGYKYALAAYRECRKDGTI